MTGSAPREGRRRALHLASAAPGLAAHFGAPQRTITIVLLAVVALAVTLEVTRRLAPPLERVLEALAMGALRPVEVTGIAGATLLMAAYAATWLLFPAAVAAPALIVAACCDPAAATIGRLAVPAGGRKTWAGTAGACGAAALVLALLGIPWPGVIGGAAAAGAAERVPGRGLDNVTIPLATATALLVLA